MGPVGVGDRVLRRVRHPSAPALTTACALVGLLTTALVVAAPRMVFGYHSPALHLVLNSVDAFVALLLGYLLHGRFRRSRGLQDLMLADALLLLGLAGLGHIAFAIVWGQDRLETLDVWLPLSLRVVAALLVVAAVLSTRSVGSAWRVQVPLLLLVAGVVGALLLAGEQRLPVALDQTPPASAVHPVITGHPLLLVGHAVGGAAFLLASVVFTRKATRRQDELLRWLGGACVLAAFARINYLLFPSLYSDWIYTGDLLRTASYALLLIGAAREIGRYWSAQARIAVSEDRRRLARELHDGVVQELGYIRAEALGIVDAAPAGRIVAACDRALDEARAAVDALGRGSDDPLGVVLHRAARQVAERYGAHVVVELDDDVDGDQAQRHALVRIAREAVSNGIRHGGARRVRLRLACQDGRRRLVIEDDGSGFEQAHATEGTGYGLTSMRERATALPGTFEIHPAPTRGTTVVVTW